MVKSTHQVSPRIWRHAASASTIALALVVAGASAAWGLGTSRPHVTVPELRAACNADAQTIETAVAAYDADPPSNCTKDCVIGFETLSGPGSIKVGNTRTYGHGTQAQYLLQIGDINNWPASPHYAISLAIHNYPKRALAGEALIYVPATNKHPTIYDDESSKTGCNAI